MEREETDMMRNTGSVMKISKNQIILPTDMVIQESKIQSKNLKIVQKSLKTTWRKDSEQRDSQKESSKEGSK